MKTALYSAILIAFAGTVLAQQPLGSQSRDAKEQEKQRIESQAKTEKAQCNRLDGNAEDVCEAEAKAKEKMAKAELDAKYDPSPRNQRKAAAMRAEGEFEVAKQRCQDLGGTGRAECRKDARARYDEAMAQVDRQYPAPGPAAAGVSSIPR